MSELKVELDPQAINKLVAEAILQSAIGTQLEKVINKNIETLSRSYDNPIEPVVQSEIREAVTKIVREKYGEMIRQKVAEKVTEQFTEDLFDKLWQAFERKY